MVSVETIGSIFLKVFKLVSRMFDIFNYKMKNKNVQMSGKYGEKKKQMEFCRSV